MAGTLDSPHRAARFARVPPRPRRRSRGRSERKAGSVPRLGNCGGEDEGALRSGCRGQRAAWRGKRGEFGGFAGCELQIWEGVGRTGLRVGLASLEWRRRGPRREEGDGRTRWKRQRERERGVGNGKGNFSNVFFGFAWGGFTVPPPALRSFLKWSPAWASCWAAGVLAVAYRMTR